MKGTMEDTGTDGTRKGLFRRGKRSDQQHASVEHAVRSTDDAVATVDDLERIAADDAADVAAMKGWRREMFGENALALKHGKLALAVDKHRVIAVERAAK